MEINDLKSVWKKANDQEEPGYWVSKEDVKRMIESRSKLTIADVRRAMRLKLIFLFVSTLVGITGVVFFKSGLVESDDFWLGEWLTISQMGNMLVFMSVILSFILVLSASRYKKVVSLEKSSLPLNESLRIIREIIRGVINMGIYGDVIGVPVLAAWGMWIYYYGETGFEFDIRLIYVLLAVIVLPTLVYFKNSRFMHRRYGHFILAIDENLEELEATDLEKDSDQL